MLANLLGAVLIAFGLLGSALGLAVVRRASHRPDGVTPAGERHEVSTGRMMIVLSVAAALLGVAILML